MGIRTLLTFGQCEQFPDERDRMAARGALVLNGAWRGRLADQRNL